MRVENKHDGYAPPWRPPAALEPDFEIRLAGRIKPRPKSAAADELAIAVIEQRPVLNATGPLPLDLGAELLSDLGIGEFAAGISRIAYYFLSVPMNGHQAGHGLLTKAIL
ncbi:MAG TPA: hypothetical protein VKH18_01745 [Terriglobales bacterium]|nr:hypothetical protein [Terriglobales bacterium]